MVREKLARLRLLVTLLAVVAPLVAAPCDAQTQGPSTASSLVAEGRRLMKGGHYGEACLKLEQATKLDATAGGLLALGDCYTHTMRSASAWTAFGDAASAASRAGHAKEAAEAKRRRAALEPKLSKLAIRVTADAPGLVVKMDDVAIDRDGWGKAVPVDPGAHTVSAEAAGRNSWSSTVVANQPGQTTNVDVPDLAPVAPTPPVADTASPPTVAPDSAGTEPGRYWTTRRKVGVAVAGAGIIGVGVGGVLGLVAKSQYNSAAGESGSQRHADSESAVNTGNVATIVAGVSAAVAVGGLVLWLTAPRASVQVGASGSMVLVRGAF